MYIENETGFLRLNEVLRLIPLSSSTFWRKVKSGEFPQPVKISERCTAWRVEDINDLIKFLGDRT